MNYVWKVASRTTKSPLCPTSKTSNYRLRLYPPPANLTPTQETRLQTEEIYEDKQLVSTVERISRIVSPYFIAIVGLALYERNFLFGTVFILIGILSLLRVTTNDVANFFGMAQKLLGLEINRPYFVSRSRDRLNLLI